MQIIIKKKNKYQGKSRSELEENLRKDGYQTMSREQLDKLKFVERKQKER